MSRFGSVSHILTILSAATMLCGWADRIDRRRDCFHNNAPDTYPVFIDRNDDFTQALPALQYMRIEFMDQTAHGSRGSIIVIFPRASRIASENNFRPVTMINDHLEKIRLRRNKCYEKSTIYV